MPQSTYERAYESIVDAGGSSSRHHAEQALNQMTSNWGQSNRDLTRNDHVAAANYNLKHQACDNKIADLKAKIRQQVEKNNVLKRKIKKQSFEKQQMQQRIEELELNESTRRLVLSTDRDEQLPNEHHTAQF